MATRSSVARLMMRAFLPRQAVWEMDLVEDGFISR
jgi:hypothetical protein